MDTAQPRSLVKKLAEVMASVERIPKSGWNDFHKYKYALEADIVSAVRMELASRHLVIFPDVVAHSVRQNEKGGDITTLTIAYTIEDGESGETRTFRMVGEGQDKGDKGAYKAETGAGKFSLLKLLLVATGNDPEADTKPEKDRASQKPQPPPKADPKPVDTTKLVTLFAALGVTYADLSKRIGRPVNEATEADVATLRGYFKALKTAAPTAEQEAKRIEAEKAEAGIAAEQAKVKTALPAVMAAVVAEAVAAGKDPRFVAFESLVTRIRAAASPAEVTLIHAEASKQPLFTAGDLKALHRSSADRILILEDAAKRRPAPTKEAPGEIPF